MIERWCLVFMIAITANFDICIGGGAGNVCKVIEGAAAGKSCVFPFIWGLTGKTYNECAYEPSEGDTYPWCSTKVNESGIHVTGGGHWGKCDPDNCPIDPCPGGWTYLKTGCYRFLPQSGDAETLATANSVCAGEGGYLAQINNQYEQFALRQFHQDHQMNLTGWVWLGATDVEKEGQWKWTHSDQNMTFEAWEDGEPNDAGNEDCLVAWHRFKWFDISCEHKYPGRKALCEHPGFSTIQPTIKAKSTASPGEEVLLFCKLEDFPEAEVAFHVSNQDGDEIGLDKLSIHSANVKIGDMDNFINVTCAGIGKGPVIGSKSITIDHADCFLRNQVSNTGSFMQKLADTPDLCQKLCASAKTCIGFDWTKNGKACRLLEARKKNATQEKGWITGPKQCANQVSKGITNKGVIVPWVWIAVSAALLALTAAIIILVICRKKTVMNNISPQQKQLPKSEKSKTMETKFDVEDDGLYDSVRKNSKKGKKMKDLKRSDLADKVEEDCYVTVTEARSISQASSDESIYD